MSTTWYFAYGSNMEMATLRGRRGIEFRRSLAARVPGWRIVFDKPPLVPIGESFANLIADPHAEVLGVLFEVSDVELEAIELSEGVRIGNYDRVSVEAHPLQRPEEIVAANTLVSDRRDPELAPSTRYMAVLIEGAIEHGLPAAYVEWLRSVPARPQSEDAARFRADLDEALRRLRR